MAAQSSGASDLAAILQLFSAFSGNRAARRESKALKKQGNLAAEESRVEAERREEEGRRFQASQGLGFLKSGVSLAGSPLLVLAETGEETQRQVTATLKGGVTRRSLLREKARIARTGGRGQLVGGVGAAAATSGFSGFSGGGGGGGAATAADSGGGTSGGGGGGGTE